MVNSCVAGTSSNEDTFLYPHPVEVCGVYTFLSTGLKLPLPDILGNRLDFRPPIPSLWLFPEYMRTFSDFILACPKTADFFVGEMKSFLLPPSSPLLLPYQSPFLPNSPQFICPWVYLAQMALIERVWEFQPLPYEIPLFINMGCNFIYLDILWLKGGRWSTASQKQIRFYLFFSHVSLQKQFLYFSASLTPWTLGRPGQKTFTVKNGA